MVKNERLSKIVLGKLYDHLKDKDNKLIGKDKEEGSRIILGYGQGLIDQRARFKIIDNRTAGFGYDFEEKMDVGISPKDMYEAAIKRVIDESGSEYKPIFVDGGVVDNRYGWYVVDF